MGVALKGSPTRLHSERLVREQCYGWGLWSPPFLFVTDWVPLLHNQFGVVQLLATGSRGLIGAKFF
jgi:hypothetical protein